jgi:two-component system, OmpR family, sensor histidine kinase BaeS
MNPENNGVAANQSIRSVRRRLWLLLLRAFGVVVLLIVVFMLGVIFFVLSFQASQNPFYKAPVAYLLESYYTGHGSWAGVEDMFARQSNLNAPALRAEWQRAVLLDAAGQVVVDQGVTDTPRIGAVYPKNSNDTWITIRSGTELAGYLVFDPGPVSFPLRLAAALLPTIAGISIILGILILVIGLLLMRRVVDPLSEVIDAARCVASGDFSARVPLRRRHDDLYALSASFNRMAESLEHNDQQRRSMLADVAHELRTPITVLRGRLEGILDGIYPADEAYVAPALEEVYLLERLVDDLRLLTLAEVRQLPLERRPFDLGEMARRVSATFEAEADELGIQIVFHPNEAAPGEAQPALVLGDPQRVEQVIGNLIGNALRYVPTGGRVTVRLAREAGFAWLSVADDGPGVAEEDLAFIFDRFWRGEKSRARASGGAGLGLAIARQLVEAQGGKIEAQNLAGGGFEVRFRLPVAG